MIFGEALFLRTEETKNIPKPPFPKHTPFSPEGTATIEPLKIHVFDDFLCEYCAENFTKVLLPLRDSEEVQKKNAEIIFHHIPIHGEQSEIMGKAGICAFAQGKYWEFAEEFFPVQKKTVWTARKAIANVGGSSTEMNTCLNAESTQIHFDNDVVFAREKNVRATPTIIIGKEIFEGIVPLENLERAVRRN